MRKICSPAAARVRRWRRCSRGPRFPRAPPRSTCCASDMLTLYDAHGSPCARRVRAVLLEKGLSWTTRLVDLTRMEQKRPEYLDDVFPRPTPLPPRPLGARAGEDVAGVRARDGEGLPSAYVRARHRAVRPAAAARRGPGRRAESDRRSGPPRLGAAGLRRRGHLGRRGRAPRIVTRPAARSSRGGTRRARLADWGPLLDRRSLGRPAGADVSGGAAAPRAGATPAPLRLARAALPPGRLAVGRAALPDHALLLLPTRL